jgi:hypothetical protein
MRTVSSHHKQHGCLDAAKEERVSIVFHGEKIDAPFSIVLSRPILRFFEI